MQNELDPHFNFDISRAAPRRQPMRTAADVEQMLEQLKPDIMERMGLAGEDEWQVTSVPREVPCLLDVPVVRCSQGLSRNQRRPTCH